MTASCGRAQRAKASVWKRFVSYCAIPTFPRPRRDADLRLLRYRRVVAYLPIYLNSIYGKQ